MANVKRHYIGNCRGAGLNCSCHAGEKELGKSFCFMIKIRTFSLRKHDMYKSRKPGASINCSFRSDLSLSQVATLDAHQLLHLKKTISIKCPLVWPKSLPHPLEPSIYMGLFIYYVIHFRGIGRSPPPPCDIEINWVDPPPLSAIT